MPESQTTSISLETVRDYFAHLNPIACKIAQDINEATQAYGSLWHKLNSDEHAAIINETIIRPEISLRYFDKFDSPSLISSASSSASSKYVHGALSFVVEGKNETHSSHIDNIQSKNYPKKIKLVKAKDSDLILKSYGFDRTRLRTYSSQKVALKIMRDEMLGTYRDEHSKPFSYKTKSQINLHIFTDNTFQNDEDGERSCLLSSSSALIDDDLFKIKLLLSDALRQTATKCKDLQTELICHVNKIEENEMNTKSAEKENNCSWKGQSHKNASSTNSNIKQSSVFNETNYVTPRTAHTYTVNSDDYFGRRESANLMQNSCSSDLLSAYSSSAVSSDDDQENDETLCEDVKLLENDISLRRGFDFLNNW